MSSEPFADVAETPSAVVYFAGDRAYKLKKPVDLGFLDFTSRQARALACARETELNRRFAPDVYLGVGELRDPDGQIYDHLVVMRRMPAERRLSALVAAGAPASASVRQLARMLAAIHAAAPRSAQISEAGSAHALLGRWRDNISQTLGHVLAADAIGEIDRLARRFVAGRVPLFAARMAAGRIVDGHGDLLADDVYCLDDGPRILDCLDFDDRLRFVDGLDDAAFLAMDLERLGAADLGRQFIDWYAEFSGDPAPASLRQHYVAYRAFVRAKVACIKASQGGASAASAGRDARQLADLTLRHLRAGAVTLVLIGGLPGTGKSAIAGAVASQLAWTVLSSDRIRKELAGLAPATSAAAPYGTGIYTPAATKQAYAELLDRAAALLARGESVIADASWLSAEQREAAAEVAGAVGADLVQLRCVATPGLARQRMLARQSGVAVGGGSGGAAGGGLESGAGASDADAEIARQLAAVADPWPTAMTLDTEGGGVAGGQTDSFAVIVRQALEGIRPHGPEHVWRPTRPLLCPG